MQKQLLFVKLFGSQMFNYLFLLQMMKLIHKKKLYICCFCLGNILLFNLESENSLHEFDWILVSFILNILINCNEVRFVTILHAHRIKLTTKKYVQ